MERLLAESKRRLEALGIQGPMKLPGLEMPDGSRWQLHPGHAHLWHCLADALAALRAGNVHDAGVHLEAAAEWFQPPSPALGPSGKAHAPALFEIRRCFPAGYLRAHHLVLADGAAQLLTLARDDCSRFLQAAKGSLYSLGLSSADGSDEDDTT